MSFLDSASHFTYIKKMTSDVIMTWVFPIPNLIWQNYGDFWIQHLKPRLSGHFWWKNKIFPIFGHWDLCWVGLSHVKVKVIQLGNEHQPPDDIATNGKK